MTTANVNPARAHGHHRPNKQCLECGAAYYADPARYFQRRYCSTRCRVRARGFSRTAFDGRTNTMNTRAPRRGQPGFIGTLPDALALVEAQLTVSSGPGASFLALEREILLDLWRDRCAADGTIDEEAG